MKKAEYNRLRSSYGGLGKAVGRMEKKAIGAQRSVIRQNKDSLKTNQPISRRP